MGSHLRLIGSKFLRFLDRDKSEYLILKKYRKTNIIIFLICRLKSPHFLKNNLSFSFHAIFYVLKSNFPEIQQRFGLNLKRLRESKGISLRELSSRCDLDSSKISKMENGKTNIQLSTIFELAKGLGVEAKDLLDF